MLGRLALLLILGSTLLPGQSTIRPGEEGPLAVPGFEVPCVLYVPTNWQAQKKHSLIFYMHGSGDKPGTFPWRQITGGQDHLVCGLAYASQSKKENGGVVDGIQYDPVRCREMIDFIRKVRELIDTTYGVDSESVFLTGLSMGGWGVSFYGFCKEARGQYRGYAILAAGPIEHSMVDFSVTKTLPVLILNGESDKNLPAANSGRPKLEAVGAKVTQVIIPGHGHVPPLDVCRPALRAWLDSIRAQDLRARELAPMGWIEHTIAGTCSPRGPQQEVLGQLLAGEEFVKAADANKPMLILFRNASPSDAKKPPTSARLSASTLRETFSWPEAVGPPAASRDFTCVLVDLTGRTSRDDPRLNEATAPLAVFLRKDRTVATLLTRDRVKERPTLAAMKELMAPDAVAALETRIAELTPITIEMKRLEARHANLLQILANLREARLQNPSKIARTTTEITTIETRLEELRRQLPW